jgi:hypothetical protein
MPTISIGIEIKLLVVAGCHSDCSVRQLWVCPHQRNRMGLGRRHLALQPRHLRPPRPVQVLHPLRVERQGLEQSPAEQGMFHSHVILYH